MNPIASLFARLRSEKRAAFLPFLPAGDPDLAFTAEALKTLADSGASLIEVGFPFSDPIADGPVIQESYTRALNKGLKLADLFAMIREVTHSPGWKTPLVAMASYSLIWKRTPDTFLKSCQDAGLSGVVVPDLPVEEAAEFAQRCQAFNIGLTLLVTPTTSPERAAQIVAACTGFVYVVSIVGITGERRALPSQLAGMLQNLRHMTDKPLCVGFGVSQPDQVKELRAHADGVIVGSALVKQLGQAGTPEGRAKALAGLSEQVRTLSEACHG
jgi:tryptophan synthase alpha chain